MTTLQKKKKVNKWEYKEKKKTESNKKAKVIKTEFLAAGETFKAIFWHTPGSTRHNLSYL